MNYEDFVDTSLDVKPAKIMRIITCYMYSRSHYKHPVFLYVSDDLEWGKLNLLPRTRTTRDLYFVGEGFPSAAYRWNLAPLSHNTFDIVKCFILRSVGHDMAVMSLSNHTIISRGTFSYWMGFLSGGRVIRPEYFPEFRIEGSPYKSHYNEDPLKTSSPTSPLMFDHY